MHQSQPARPRDTTKAAPNPTNEALTQLAALEILQIPQTLQGERDLLDALLVAVPGEEVDVIHGAVHDIGLAQ